MSNTNSITYMSESEFDKRFNLKEFAHGDKFQRGEIDLFNEIAKSHPNRIWTCIDGDDGQLIYENQRRVVNFNYYFITEEPYGDNESISVEIDMDFD